MSRSPVSNHHPDPRGLEEKQPEEAINHGNNLFISGLSSYVNETDLQEAFGKFGTLEKVQIMRDPQTKESRGFGFVTFKDVEAATECTQALNQTDLKGRTMKIELAKRGRAHDPTPGRYLGPAKPDFRRRGGYDRRDDRRDYRRDDFRPRDPRDYPRDYRDPREFRYEERRPADRYDRYDRDPRDYRPVERRPYDYPEHPRERRPIDRYGPNDRYEDRRPPPPPREEYRYDDRPRY